MNMKKIIFILFLGILSNVFSDNNEYIRESKYIGGIYEPGSFEIINNIIVEINGERYQYVIEEIDGLTYIFYGEGFYGKRDNKKLLLFSKDFLLIYNNETNYNFYGTTHTGRRTEGYVPIKFTGVSSSLTENDINYEINNLASFNQRMPWVEGVEGNGLGEYLEFSEDHGYTNIIISIGYVDYSKPYLYKENSRPKTIKIISENYELIYHLDDTPNPQRINLPERTDKFKIEIIEVYQGTKYEDTCINFVFSDLFYGDGPF